ncbi:MAG: T9SS type A sorting domain-containing protein [Ferruginibacter sp.]
MQTTTSAPGYYVLTPQATAANYNITFTSGTLTILPVSGTGAAYINAFMSNSSTLTVRLFSPAPALSDIVLYNSSGQPLYKKNVFMPNGFVTTTIDITSFPTGIYIVKVIGTAGVILKKLLLF